MYYSEYGKHIHVEIIVFSNLLYAVTGIVPPDTKHQVRPDAPVNKMRPYIQVSCFSGYRCSAAQGEPVWIAAIRVTAIVYFMISTLVSVSSDVFYCLSDRIGPTRT